MRVALVHDYLVQYGGAERVLEALAELFPRAPIYTLIYDKEGMGGAFADRTVHTSFLQNLPLARKNHRLFPPLMPFATENLDLSNFDLVISSSTSYAKGVITGSQTTHISYCHTPMRYAWENCHRYLEQFRYSPFTKAVIPYALTYLRMWDKNSADRPDYYIANSRCVARRIRKYYAREARVIHPPVDVASPAQTTTEPPASDPYYLMLGRFLPYKHYDIVIEAFKHRDEHLKIIGAGPDEAHLKHLAAGAHNIEFLGSQSDERVRAYLQHALGFIFPSEDDFGIVPVEAMAAGTPVLAYRGGGALETVEEGTTGLFFDQQTPESVNRTLDTFVQTTFASEEIKRHAQRFTKDLFYQRMTGLISEITQTPYR